MSGRTRLGAVLATVVTAALTCTSAPAGAQAPGLDFKSCHHLVATAAAPVGTTACPGVRPGALVEVPTSADGRVLCTLNFVFVDKYKHTYIGTAGHCVLGSGPGGTTISAKRTWRPGTGPVALDSKRHKIGNFVFAIENDEFDFGLIRLTTKANPQMCHFGGPRGVNNSTSRLPVQLEAYGNGVGIGAVLPARSGVTSGMPQKDWVAAIMPIISGDSGGPVLSSDGKAVGWIVATGVGYDVAVANPPPHAGFALLERISANVAQASSALHLPLYLVTAKAL